MVTESIASTFHGEPRATRDLDIVIDPVLDALFALVDDLAAHGYYADRDAAVDRAITRPEHSSTPSGQGNKGRSHHSRDRPFSREEFARRRQADLLGTPAFIASVEDMIIAKLEWSVPFDSSGSAAMGGDACHIG